MEENLGCQAGGGGTPREGGESAEGQMPHPRSPSVWVHLFHPQLVHMRRVAVQGIFADKRVSCSPGPVNTHAHACSCSHAYPGVVEKMKPTTCPGPLKHPPYLACSLPRARVPCQGAGGQALCGGGGRQRGGVVSAVRKATAWRGRRASISQTHTDRQCSDHLW